MSVDENYPKFLPVYGIEVLLLLLLLLFCFSDSPLPSPATTINQAQSLINYFSEVSWARGMIANYIML